MRNLEDLQREFWTRFDELLDDIRDCGYSIEEANDEYISCSGEDEDVIIYLGGSITRTMYISKIVRYERG